MSKLFVAACSTLAVNKITITEYHPQTSRQAERLNSTFLLRLRHYVSEHQTDWDTFQLPLAYAYNVQIYRSVKVSPFSLALTQTPPGRAAVIPKRTNLATDDDVAPPICVRLARIEHATDLRRESDKKLRLAQSRHKKRLRPSCLLRIHLPSRCLRFHG